MAANSISTVVTQTIIVFCCISIVAPARYLLHIFDPGRVSLNFKFVGYELAKRGHNVTFIIDEDLANSGGFFKDGDGKIFEVIKVKGIFSQDARDNFEELIAASALQGKELNYDFYAKLWSYYKYHNDALLNSVELKEELRNVTFDLALITDNTIEVARLLNTINVPYAIMSEMLLDPYHAWEMRAPRNPSYFPGHRLGIDQHMTFTQRLWGTIQDINGFFAYAGFMMMAAPSFGVFDMDKSRSQLFREAELWFIRSHFTLDYPRPFPPHVIPMAGQMSRPAEPLSQDLEDFLSRPGHNGTIVFNFSTYMRSMSPDQAEIFLSAFSRLKQQVVMKYAHGDENTLPDNVRAKKWIPQNDLFGHPSTKLFISHCGCNGAFEALYHAVPILCIPLFHDQFEIAQRIVSKGIGTKMHMDGITSDKLEKAISHMLLNDSYQENINRLSAIYRDDPQTASERVVFWMEFLTRHGGATHLRSAAHDLNIFQYHLVDVYLALFLIVTATIYILWKCVTFVCCGMGKSSKHNNSSKMRPKNNNYYTNGKKTK